ncbi:MAG: UTP--glucose-1-phosphate uridylyltransferase GalU [Oscillospiraceae bacterium]|jgi:UTP--glucose-1-phosphate uridylyltransferase|nr:UTP--glucose-1-phosphate uridylyltransferase GalU [Oscillospiraceae bacterium]
MKRVRKAVIPAAGLGTRVLPATKSMPKEMLPIVDKPAIQCIVEEALNSGIEDILIITGRGKEIIENHFDKSPELESRLTKANKSEMLKKILSIVNLPNIYFLRQKEALGLGHAILCSRSFVNNEPFAVLYADDVVFSEVPACKQLINVYNEFGLSVVGVKKTKEENIQKYSSLKVDLVRENIFRCTDMVEKPKKNEILSLYSILGRCVLNPDIFNILEETKPGAGNEIQLTDAMKVIARKDSVMAVDFVGKCYDMGNKLGIMQASVEAALTHDEIGKDFKKYLESISGELFKIN